MVKILVVNKGGDIDQKTYKLEDESELYKKAGLKSVIGFEKVTSWFVECDKKMNEYIVFGKKHGNPNHENKFEFPPPIDNLLLFDKCVIIKKRKNTLKSLSIEEWNIIYEQLYGGFEDIEEESEVSEDEEDEDLPRTKTGYVEDDFVVEDYDSENDYLSELSEGEFEEDANEDEFEKTMENKVYNTRTRAKNRNIEYTASDDCILDENSVD